MHLSMTIHQEPSVCTIVTPLLYRWFLRPAMLVLMAVIFATTPDRSEGLGTLVAICFLATACVTTARRLHRCAPVTTVIDTEAGTVRVNRKGLLRPAQTWEVGLCTVAMPEIVERRAGLYDRSAFQVMTHSVVPLTGFTSLHNANRCAALVRRRAAQHPRR